WQFGVVIPPAPHPMPPASGPVQGPGNKSQETGNSFRADPEPPNRYQRALDSARASRESVQKATSTINRDRLVQPSIENQVDRWRFGISVFFVTGRVV